MVTLHASIYTSPFKIPRSVCSKFNASKKSDCEIALERGATINISSYPLIKVKRTNAMYDKKVFEKDHKKYLELKADLP